MTPLPGEVETRFTFQFRGPMLGIQTLRTRLGAIAATLVLAIATLLAVSPPASASTCYVTVGGKQHTYLCGMNVARLGWTTGWNATRVFVVGLDHQVWNIYLNGSYNSGWKSLGGYAKDGVWAFHGQVVHHPDSVLLRVVGSDNQLWCKRLLPSPPRWTGWSKAYCT